MNNRPNEVAAAKSRLIAGEARAVPRDESNRMIVIRFPITHRSGLSIHDVIKVLSCLPPDAKIMNIHEDIYRQTTDMVVQSREFEAREPHKFLPERSITWEMMEINANSSIRVATGFDETP